MPEEALNGLIRGLAKFKLAVAEASVALSVWLSVGRLDELSEVSLEKGTGLELVTRVVEVVVFGVVDGAI